MYILAVTSILMKNVLEIMDFIGVFLRNWRFSYGGLNFLLDSGASELNVRLTVFDPRYLHDEMSLCTSARGDGPCVLHNAAFCCKSDR